ncbi:hypothetical protein [Simiduia agarivorans]|nr:hypothetical protein [Simiduia agarivorans]
MAMASARRFLARTYGEVNVGKRTGVLIEILVAIWFGFQVYAATAGL